MYKTGNLGTMRKGKIPESNLDSGCGIESSLGNPRYHTRLDGSGDLRCNSHTLHHSDE